MNGLIWRETVRDIIQLMTIYGSCHHHHNHHNDNHENHHLGTEINQISDNCAAFCKIKTN